MGTKKVLVSACLMGRNCKYNGGNNYNEWLTGYLKEKQVLVVTACPEVEGGLFVPRTPVELVDGVAINRNGENVDACFQAGVKKVIARARNEGVVAAILQPRSPSCGVEQIYDGSFTGKLVPGEGMLTAALRREGIPVFDAGAFSGEGRDAYVRRFEEIIQPDHLSSGK